MGAQEADLDPLAPLQLIPRLVHRSVILNHHNPPELTGNVPERGEK